MIFRTTLTSITLALTALAWIAFSGAKGVAADQAEREAADAAAVQSGREALSRVTRLPWYDRAEDRVRPIHVVPRGDSDSENRGSQWTSKKMNTAAPGPVFTGTGIFGPVLQWLGLTALVVLLGVIAFSIAKTFLKDEVSESTSIRKVVQSAGSVDRVEALPVKVRVAAANFLDEARRLYEEGNYSEAILYLFSHELVALDTHRAIRLAKGKTNRQYLRELRQRPTLKAILEGTMIAFEDVFFGKKSLSRERFEDCWRQLAGFDGELESERAAA